MANHGASPWGGQGYVSVHKPTASCLSQIRETLSTGGGQWGLDSSDERKGSGESYSDKTKEKAHEKIKEILAKSSGNRQKSAAFFEITPVACFDLNVHF